MKNLIVLARGQQTGAALLVLAIVVLALYARTLGGYFLADDFAYVATSSAASLGAWPSRFFREEGTEIWGYSLGLLRPFYSLSGIIQSRLFEGDATGYRVVSVTLHIVNAWLVFALARKSLRASPLVAFAAALLFAIHPVHAETVAWIGGQSDLLPTAMFLGALLALMRFRERGGVGAAAAIFAVSVTAVFTKENTVVLPLLFAAYDVLLLARAKVPRTVRGLLQLLFPYFLLLLVLALYFTCRRIAFGGGAGVPLGESMSALWWQGLLLKYLEYLSHLTWPVYASPGSGWVPFATGGRTAAILLLIAAAIAAVTALYRRHYDAARAILFFGPVWFLLVTAPFLFTYNYYRHMYLAAAGICILVAAAIHVVAHNQPLLRHAFVVLLACGWTVLNIDAVNRWVDTGRASKNMHKAIRRLTSKPPGSIVLLELPGGLRDAHLFHWSSPFLLGKPFCPAPLTERLIVLEAPISYYNEGVWARHPAIEQIANIDPGRRAYYLDYDGKGGAYTVTLDTQKVRAAAESMRAAMAAKPDPPVRDHWRSFVDAAR